jgi:hypothetical protein
VTGPVWRKSTRSGMNGCVEVAFRRSSGCNNATCVEVAIDQTVVLVRDSKDPDGPRLSFSREEWRAFLAGVGDGEFDL